MYMVVFWDIAHHSAEPILQRCDSHMVTNLWTNIWAKIRIFGFCRFESVFKWNSYMDASNSWSIFSSFFSIFYLHFSHICNRNMHEGIILLSVWNMTWKSIIFFVIFFGISAVSCNSITFWLKGFVATAAAKAFRNCMTLKRKKNDLL